MRPRGDLPVGVIQLSAGTFDTHILFMRFTASRQRRIAWVSLFLLAVGLLAPIAAQRLAAAHGSTLWAEVCGPTGIKLVALDREGAPEQGKDHSGVHCPFCRLPLDQAAVLPPIIGLAPLAEGDATPVFNGVESFTYRRPAWTFARSRAPPHSS